MDFLGVRLYSDRIRLSRKGCVRVRKKFQHGEQKYLGGDWSEEDLQRCVGTLFAYMRQVDTMGWRKQIIAQLGAVV